MNNSPVILKSMKFENEIIFSEGEIRSGRSTIFYKISKHFIAEVENEIKNISSFLNIDVDTEINGKMFIENVGLFYIIIHYKNLESHIYAIKSGKKKQ